MLGNFDSINFLNEKIGINVTGDAKIIRKMKKYRKMYASAY